MRFLITTLFCSSFFISCSKYQYVAIESDLPKNKTGEIIIETDTVLVTYKFSGADAPAIVQVFNKLDVPLFINWQRSAIILDKKSLAHWDGNAELNAVSKGGEYQWTSSTSTSRNTMSGNIKQSPGVTFIPPSAFVEASPIYLTNKFFKLEYDQVKSMTVNGSTVRTQYFNTETTPLKFRSYLTLSISPDFDKNIVFDHEFWVKEVSQTVLPPNQTDFYKGRDDKFYVSKSTGVGVFLGVTGFLAYIIIATTTTR